MDAFEQQRGRQLYAEAGELEAGYSFSEAYRGFLRAADLLRSADEDVHFIALVRAGLCLEKSQTWRAHSALWEMLGNRLGEKGFPGETFSSPNREGQSGMFHIVSWKGWLSPEDGYYQDDEEVGARRHQQFWAYLWAAQTAEAEGYHTVAAENFRKAAIAAENSCFGDRPPESADGTWNATRLRRVLGRKHRLAAEWFGLAMRNEILGSGTLRGAYRAQHVKWSHPPDPSRPSELHARYADDVDRFMSAWDAYRRIRRSLGDMEEVERSQHDEIRRLTEVQRLLRLRGEERLSAEMFRKKRAREISFKAGFSRALAIVRYGLLESRPSSRLLINGLIVLVANTLFIPILYRDFKLVAKAADLGPVNYVDCMIHSWAATLGMSVQQLTPIHPVGQALTVSQSVLLYFLLGYLLYVWTYSPEE